MSPNLSIIIILEMSSFHQVRKAHLNLGCIKASSLISFLHGSFISHGNHKFLAIAWQEQHAEQQPVEQVSKSRLLHVLTGAQSVSECSWCSWDTLSFGGLGMHWSRYKPRQAHFWWQCDNGRTELRTGETPVLTQALGTFLKPVQCVFALLEFWVCCTSESCRCCSHHRAEQIFCSLCHAPL